MVNLSTEAFPYTAGYVKELLKLEDAQLMAYASALSITPRQDDVTGGLVFTHRDVELLKKGIEMKMLEHAEINSLVAVGSGASGPSGYYGTHLPERPSNESPYGNAFPALSLAENTPQANPALAHSAAGGENNLAVIVEAVSQAKEGILKDLSRLLDDKLSGLDEVVVELIRSKSENDSMKHQVSAMQAEVEALRTDLARFKPVQFGFYRKMG